jgi:hypothetical protein
MPMKIPESCKKFEDQPETPESKKLGEIIAANVKKANSENFVNAFGAGVIFEYVLLAITFGLSFLLLRHIRRETYQQSH